MIDFQETTEFAKDLKKLSKKYRTLAKDFRQLKELYLAEAPRGNGSKHWNLLHKNDSLEIYKVRMHCDSTRGKFFRVIYAYYKETDTIELIEFIEIYFKGNKASEDKDRIDDYLNLFSKKR
jgi:mRNA-degrading endonuclease RelE of RelBE toxin-antitoxin system